MGDVKHLIVIALAIVLAGCATERLNLPVDYAITPEKTAQIKKGATTMDEIKAVFGEPTDRLVFPENESWFYKDFNLMPLQIDFDENGIVKNYITDD
jgi:outer membrane protein assembly factor BamE (lipoprotein component of BamABCDE complex)